MYFGRDIKIKNLVIVGVETNFPKIKNLVTVGVETNFPKTSSQTPL